MQRLEHPSLRGNPWPDTKWTAGDKPILIVDGALYPIRSLSQVVSGHAAYVVGVKDRDLPPLASRLDVEFLHFYELRAANLAPLSAIPRLRHLKINWNTKVTELDAVGALVRLETLVLVDTPKVRDLSPLEALSELAAFEYSGGIWNKQHVVSLEPLASLPRLEELVLTNLTVESGGLRPLAGCKSLKTLALSNQFDTEDYAYLSVALPNVQCDAFQPWRRVSHTDGTDTMITGRRKPFLNSATDAPRIAAYEEAFRKLQAQFASDPALRRTQASKRRERDR
jgi:hypothetical protein